MKIFPYALIRLGGEPFEQFDKMNSGEAYSQVSIIASLKETLEKEKMGLCDMLFSHIQKLSDPQHQNIIQNIRRDIFNSRKIKNNKLARAKDILPDQLNQQLESYFELNQKIQSQILASESIYQTTLQQCREICQSLANSPTVRKGLLLSSKSLLDRIDSYAERANTAFRKKEYQIEQGVLKYLTRIYTKTSPFSTFTNLALAQLSDEGHSAIIDMKHSGQEQVKGHIRLNNYLLKYLLDLFKNYRPAYRLIHLRPNPTIENKGDHFLFLTNNDNIESFQRVPFNPVVELIINTTLENESGILFHELVNTLQENIDAGEDELESYIKQLIDYGCLEYNFGVSGIDPDWDIKLIQKLRPLIDNNVSHIAPLAEVLKALRKMADEYAENDEEGRKRLLQKAYDTFRAICMTIHKAAGLPEEERKTKEEKQEEYRKKQQELKAAKEDKGEKEKNEDEEKKDDKPDEPFQHQVSTFFHFKPEQIFYEDTTRDIKATLNEPQLNSIISTIHSLLQSLRSFRGMEDERIKMKYFFLQQYEKNETVDLLAFYEDFYREYKKPLKEYEEKKKKEKEEAAKSSENKDEPVKVADKQENTVNPFLDIPALKVIQEQRKEWNDNFATQFKGISDTGRLEIAQHQIDATNQNVGLEFEESPGKSYGTFIQFYNEGNEVKAVVNSSLSGYGKMLSRFLHVFDVKVTDTLRKWNNDSNSGDRMFIENCDASYFNANLHPPLMPLEIWMPGGHNTLPEDKQIPITNFELKYNTKEDTLQLFHKSTHKQVHVFDLGFQGHMGRSQLFQLLDKFTMSEYLSPYPVVSAINGEVNKKEKEEKPDEGKNGISNQPEIQVCPRVVFEKQIVLQRKSWFIPKSLIPEKMPIDSDWQFYLNINEWRLKQGMPDEVFVFINTNRGNQDIDPELTKKLTRDDYKPQYINFRNPLLVNLFEKIIGKVPTSLKIEEMLPNSAQMLKIDQQRFVSEFMVQWYT